MKKDGREGETSAYLSAVPLGCDGVVYTRTKAGCGGLADYFQQLLGQTQVPAAAGNRDAPVGPGERPVAGLGAGRERCLVRLVGGWWSVLRRHMQLSPAGSWKFLGSSGVWRHL